MTEIKAIDARRGMKVKFVPWGTTVRLDEVTKVGKPVHAVQLLIPLAAYSVAWDLPLWVVEWPQE